MTLDAQDWVWRHSQSRGNVRLALLALADATTDDTATVRMGTAEITRRINASKGAAVEALQRAVASGELEIAEAAKGSRAALYRIPGAVRYARRSGPEPRPETERSGIPTGSGLRSGNPTTKAPVSGPVSRPEPDLDEGGLWSESPTGSGRETGPHHSSIEGVNEGVREAPTAVVPEFARPLVDQITAAKFYPAWDLRPTEWFQIDALLKRSGVDMLAAVAVRAASKRDVSHARYFLRAWLNLPPAAAPGTAPPVLASPGADVIPLDRAPRRGRAANAAQMFATAAGLTPQEHHR
ncbi:hypothetical protein ACFQ7B_00255 [Streptomyces erythrochromogenes]|uniref:hypothetical protein n=1 Tax=Streptomyces erythrochromogenes TaxID=285574 RepID=UPI00367E38E2